MSLPLNAFKFVFFFNSCFERTRFSRLFFLRWAEAAFEANSDWFISLLNEF